MSKNIHEDLIVAPTTEGARRAGVCVWWDLNGAVDAERLAADLEAAGVGIRPPNPPAPGRVLKRAMQAVATTEQVVRPVKEGRYKGGHAIVQVQPDPRTGWPTGHTVAIGSIDAEGEPVVEAVVGRLRDAVLAEYRVRSGKVTGNDLSGWLSGIAMPALQGVCLRPTGGFYFVPESETARLDRLTRALQSGTGHEFFMLDAHTRATAIRSVLKAIEKEAEELVAMVRERANGRRNARGIRGDEERLDRMVRKIEEYERALGVTLETLKSRCVETKAQVGASVLEEADL